MDISNIGNEGNIERATERANEAGPRAYVLIPFVPKAVAGIRKFVQQDAAIENRLEALARSRDALVEAARQKLLSGELDSRTVYAATAEKLASSGFFTV